VLTLVTLGYTMVHTPWVILWCPSLQVEEERKNNIFTEMRASASDDGRQPTWVKHMAAIEEGGWHLPDSGIEHWKISTACTCTPGWSFSAMSLFTAWGVSWGCAVKAV
jgi:hypothetical protein